MRRASQAGDGPTVTPRMTVVVNRPHRSGASLRTVSGALGAGSSIAGSGSVKGAS
jgi:hypothetical protein